MTTDTSPRGCEASGQDAPAGTADAAVDQDRDPADETWTDDNTWGKALNDEEFSQAVRRVLGSLDARVA